MRKFNGENWCLPSWYHYLPISFPFYRPARRGDSENDYFIKFLTNSPCLFLLRWYTCYSGLLIQPELSARSTYLLARGIRWTRLIYSVSYLWPIKLSEHLAREWVILLSCQQPRIFTLFAVKWGMMFFFFFFCIRRKKKLSRWYLPKYLPLLYLIFSVFTGWTLWGETSASCAGHPSSDCLIDLRPLERVLRKKLEPSDCLRDRLESFSVTHVPTSENEWPTRIVLRKVGWVNQMLNIA